MVRPPRHRHRHPPDEDVVRKTHRRSGREAKGHPDPVRGQFQGRSSRSARTADVHEPHLQTSLPAGPRRRPQLERLGAGVVERRACPPTRLARLEGLLVSLRSMRTVGDHPGGRLHVRVPERALGFTGRAQRREATLDPERSDRVELGPGSAAGEMLAVPHPRAQRLHPVALLRPHGERDADLFSFQVQPRRLLVVPGEVAAARARIAAD